jgi:hypothetical protein
VNSKGLKNLNFLFDRGHYNQWLVYEVIWQGMNIIVQKKFHYDSLPRSKVIYVQHPEFYMKCPVVIHSMRQTDMYKVQSKLHLEIKSYLKFVN